MDEPLLFDTTPFTLERENTRATDGIKNRLKKSHSKSTPVAREIKERVYFFKVGDRVIFCDNHMTSQAFNGRECIVETLESPINPDRVVVRFDDGTRLHPKAEDLKSTPVAREIKERVYFHWVEEYLMRQRYLHWRYCHIRTTDNIQLVEKMHIRGSSSSVREGRAMLVREAIAGGKSPVEIEELIRSW